MRSHIQYTYLLHHQKQSLHIPLSHLYSSHSCLHNFQYPFFLILYSPSEFPNLCSAAHHHNPLSRPAPPDMLFPSQRKSRLYSRHTTSLYHPLHPLRSPDLLQKSSEVRSVRQPPYLPYLY